MVEALDDAFLLVQLKAGNDQAIEMLYARYSERLYQYAAKHYQLPHEDAADVVQTTFWYIIERIQTYEEDRGVGTGWIYAICKNIIIDTQRRKKSEPWTADLDLPSEEYSLEEGVMKQEWSEAVKRAWDKLLEEDRQELARGRGRGPGRKTWHQAAERFRALVSFEEHPHD